MNNEIIVDNDLLVFVLAIQQKRTYANFAVGSPTKELNQKILLGLKELAREFCGVNAIHLIEPEQKLADSDSGFPMYNGFGEETYLLPRVFCIATLFTTSVYWDRSEDYDYAKLGLIWFQDNFGFPNSATREKIKTVPFKQICDKISDW